MRKGITAHVRLKKKTYQPQNTKISSSHKIAFSAEKRHRANLCYVPNLFPFSIDPRDDSDPL